jgi:hypothetical protein
MVAGERAPVEGGVVVYSVVQEGRQEAVASASTLMMAPLSICVHHFAYSSSSGRNEVGVLGERLGKAPECLPGGRVHVPPLAAGGALLPSC